MSISYATGKTISDIASNLKVHAFTIFGSLYMDALTAGDVAAETEIKYDAAANVKTPRILDEY